MKIENKFGIVITCYRGDIHFTKGLLASIKYFCGDIPICLIVDGSFKIKNLGKAYNIVKVLRKENVQNEFLKNNCFGTRFSNLVAFYENPFERFLYIDSDTVLWGNILENFNPKSADFIHGEPHEPYTPFIIKHQYFDFDRIFNYTESFNWEGCHFFNSGIFSMKTGIFSIDEVKELRQICKTDRTLMPRDVQGLLSICVYRNFLKKNITVLEAKLQTIMPMFEKEELTKMFVFVDEKPIINNNTIIHWAGQKPNFRQDSVFNEPMNFFRKMNLHYTGSIFKNFYGIYFRYEEIKAIYHVYYKNQPIKILKRIFGAKNIIK